MKNWRDEEIGEDGERGWDTYKKEQKGTRGKKEKEEKSWWLCVGVKGEILIMMMYHFNI